MESNTVQRRLAAIFAADVVGYSRLMNSDEIGTLAALKAHRRMLVDPAIAGSLSRHPCQSRTPKPGLVSTIDVIL
jgi:adenylate cyclase